MSNIAAVRSNKKPPPGPNGSLLTNTAPHGGTRANRPATRTQPNWKQHVEPHRYREDKIAHRVRSLVSRAKENGRDPNARNGSKADVRINSFPTLCSVNDEVRSGRTCVLSCSIRAVPQCRRSYATTPRTGSSGVESAPK
jgi:hypothetical protein